MKTKYTRTRIALPLAGIILAGATGLCSLTSHAQPTEEESLIHVTEALPTEIGVKIMEQLPLRDQAKARQVCSAFRDWAEKALELRLSKASRLSAEEADYLISQKNNASLLEKNLGKLSWSQLCVQLNRMEKADSQEAADASLREKLSNRLDEIETAIESVRKRIKNSCKQNLKGAYWGLTDSEFTLLQTFIYTGTTEPVSEAKRTQMKASLIFFSLNTNILSRPQLETLSKIEIMPEFAESAKGDYLKRQEYAQEILAELDKAAVYSYKGAWASSTLEGEGRDGFITRQDIEARMDRLAPEILKALSDGTNFPALSASAQKQYDLWQKEAFRNTSTH